MSRLAGSALLTLLGLMVFAPAAGADCRLPGLETTTKLIETRGRVRFSNGYSGTQLERKRRRAGGAGSIGPDWHPVGLMGSDLVWEFRIKVTGRRDGAGHCVGLKNAELTVGYDRIDVYVDRRYRPGSCQYRVILEHEKQHVRDFQSILDGYLPILRDRLAREARRAPPVRARTMQAGARHFINFLGDRLTPVIKRMRADMDAADQRLDTPENYRATQARCDGW